MQHPQKATVTPMTTNVRRRHAVAALLSPWHKAAHEIATEHTEFRVSTNEKTPKWMHNEELTMRRKRGLRSLLAASFVTRLICTRAAQGDNRAHMDLAVKVADRYRTAYNSKCEENGAFSACSSMAHAQAFKILEDEFIAEIMFLLLTEYEAGEQTTDPRMKFDEAFFWLDVMRAFEHSGTTESDRKWITVGRGFVLPVLAVDLRAFRSDPKGGIILPDGNSQAVM